MSTPTILYRARDRFAATASGVPRRFYPLPADSPIQFAAYAFAQEFEQWMANFPPAPKNTRSNDAALGLGDANAILTSLSQPNDARSGTGKFTGTFAIVPASWDDFPTATVTFPGWIDGPAVGDSRPAFTRNITIRTRYDYFVLDPAGVLAAGAAVLDSGGNAITRVASKGAIPQLTRGQWLNTKASGGGRIPVPNAEVPDLVPAGGATVGDALYTETAPTLGNYKLWAAVATAFKVALNAGTTSWDATHPPAWDGAGTAATYGQYLFQDSVLTEYAGNIIQRASSYALFQ